MSWRSLKELSPEHKANNDRMMDFFDESIRQYPAPASTDTRITGAPVAPPTGTHVFTFTKTVDGSTTTTKVYGQKLHIRLLFALFNTWSEEPGALTVYCEMEDLIDMLFNEFKRPEYKIIPSDYMSEDGRLDVGKCFEDILYPL